MARVEEREERFVCFLGGRLTDRRTPDDKRRTPNPTADEHKSGRGDGKRQRFQLLQLLDHWNSWDSPGVDHLIKNDKDVHKILRVDEVHGTAACGHLRAMRELCIRITSHYKSDE